VGKGGGNSRRGGEEAARACGFTPWPQVSGSLIGGYAHSVLTNQDAASDAAFSWDVTLAAHMFVYYHIVNVHVKTSLDLVF
jgi:hypothetical protein